MHTLFDLEIFYLDYSFNSEEFVLCHTVFISYFRQIIDWVYLHSGSQSLYLILLKSLCMDILFGLVSNFWR